MVIAMAKINFVQCSECGHEQPDMGKNVACGNCHARMPTNPVWRTPDKEVDLQTRAQQCALVIIKDLDQLGIVVDDIYSILEERIYEALKLSSTKIPIR